MRYEGTLTFLLGFIVSFFSIELVFRYILTSIYQSSLLAVLFYFFIIGVIYSRYGAKIMNQDSKKDFGKFSFGIWMGAQIAKWGLGLSGFIFWSLFVDTGILYGISVYLGCVIGERWKEK